MNIDVLRNDLKISQVDLAKEVHSLKEGGVIFFVGRSSECHVCLEDMQVSREHALLIVTKEGWKIKKSSSVADVKVNGTNVEEQSLKNGDRIEIGPFVLVVSAIVAENEPPFDQNSSSSEEVEGEDDREQEVTQTEYFPNEETEDGAVESGDENQLDEQGDASESIEDGFEDPGSLDLDSSEESLEEAIETSDEEMETPDFTSNDFGDAEDSDVSEGDEGFGFDEGADDFGGGFDVAESVGEGTVVIQSFAKVELEIFGEYAPFDRYLVDKKEVTIGRDPQKCDIVLNDPEVSSLHALIKKTNIDLTIEDLKSGNGTLLNGSRINTANLNPGDEFIIGSTTFTVNVGSDLLSQQEDKLMPVDDNQEIEIEEIIEVDEDFGEGVDFSDEGDKAEVSGDSFGAKSKPKNESLFSKEALQDPEKRKKLLIIAVVLLGVWVLLDDDSPSDPSRETTEETASSQDSASRDFEEKDDVAVELTAEERQQAEAIYQLAREFFDQGRYSETIFELQRLFAITPDYKNARQIDSLAKQGLARLEEIERERRREIEREERRERVNTLLERAREAVKERQAQAAEAFFVQILELDPQNFEVPQLRIELEAWQREQERKAMAKAEAEAERQRMERALAPGRQLYSRNDWYRAINELEAFLQITPMDEDLVKEGRRMLEESNRNLNSITQPLLGRARSLREGRDLKGAFEAYREVLQYYPTHQEAITEMNAIEDRLTLRSRRIYREALIAESLSLFESAREKFQEVQQVAPTGSEYYIKATERLREYLE